jgi:hypothetical protein
MKISWDSMTNKSPYWTDTLFRIWASNVKRIFLTLNLPFKVLVNLTGRSIWNSGKPDAYIQTDATRKQPNYIIRRSKQSYILNTWEKRHQFPVIVKNSNWRSAVYYTSIWLIICENSVTISQHWNWILYRAFLPLLYYIETPHPPRHPVTAIVMMWTMKDTLCI